ncbi:hypothetical protein GCM10007964_08140 [Sphaerisporangium melleum]|uniref:Glycosyltransferase RgtA/B/C/D-like domain-containing protein n=2 Tax=Sphaerisporangium melleum TaxID=321316 RepID=A0A917QTN9_9ACTN|nr:hypothetical protein GCM10007964_08140 [Sphaerisporangium melleum]
MPAEVSALMQLLIVVMFFGALALLVRGVVGAGMARRVLPVLLLALAVRLVVYLVLDRGALIGYGGDNVGYELLGIEIAERWQAEGISYVTADGVGRPYSVPLHSNLFALVVYLCGGPAPMACTAFVGFLACVLCLILYRFALLIGADERGAFRLLAVMAFMPAFLLHTADTYKDGFNALFVVAALALGVSLTRRYALWKLLLLPPLLWCVWGVRPYMVYMCLLPLALGMTGLKRLISLRAMVITIVALFVVLFDPASLQESAPMEDMWSRLAQGQSSAALNSNAGLSGIARGSGVRFEDGGNVWSHLGPKIFYTILSPFPWTGGSLALQLGKIDTLVWYMLLALAVAGARRLWSTDRSTLLILLLFIVPATVVYASTMANIGLIFRQRMPVVMVTSLLAAVAWSGARRDGPAAGEPPVPSEPDEEPRVVSEPDEAPSPAGAR